MKNKNTVIAFLVLISVFALFFYSCATHLVKREELVQLNEYYSDKTYYLKENIYIGNDEVIKKGASVKIWVESTPTILKIKCYPSDEDREHVIGKLIIYIVNDEYKKRFITREELDSIIGEKLVAYNPKKRRHR
ncbi:MAG: type II secretion system-associated lipoprotein [Leptospiraceae bacterium]|nr:type II secretion system-associated lipoprotein [Leptospiraceae bacterium]MCK6379832.1 type II secretion system-associated lipoprotein [Leptospiraceae bacterium]NUM40976.1 type II secretion system-associated lipoprotein [Leptospiraceae bacterium]